jgi:hypothetical protein
MRLRSWETKVFHFADILGPPLPGNLTALLPSVCIEDTKAVRNELADASSDPCFGSQVRGLPKWQKWHGHSDDAAFELYDPVDACRSELIGALSCAGH